MDSEGKSLTKGLSEYVNTLIKRKTQTLENALDIKNVQIKKLRNENELLTQQLKSSATKVAKVDELEEANKTLRQDMSKIHKWSTQPGDEISDQFTLDEGWPKRNEISGFLVGDDTLPDEKQENNEYSGVIEAFQKVCAGCGPPDEPERHTEMCCGGSQEIGLLVPEVTRKWHLWKLRDDNLTLPDEKQENNDYSEVNKEQKLSLIEQNTLLRGGCSSSRSIGDPSDEFDNIRKTKF